MNATAETVPVLLSLPLAEIALGKNYRHRRPSNWEAKLDELAASMKQNGQLEPVLVRPHPKPGKGATFEVVFGERRYRAAKKAELPELLAILRNVPDEQILEVQLAENDDREPPHPLDEAEAFAELVKRGATPASIAAIRGRDVRYVRERLELTKLHPKVVAALDDGQILLGHALLLCRIPEKLQPEALETMLGGRRRHEEDGAMNVTAAGHMVRERFMLKLATASFDRADAELVPEAGPCGVCPKRSGNQGELFGDVKSPDVCTDPVCFRAKLDAHWKATQKAAKTAGQVIVPKSDVTFHPFSSHVSSQKWEQFDGERYLGRGNVKIATLVGKDVKPALVQNPNTGAIVALVPRAEVDRAAKSYQAKRSKGKDEGATPARAKVTPAEKARREKQKLEGQARQQIAKNTLGSLADACAKVEQPAKLTALLRDVVRLQFGICYGLEGLVERRMGNAGMRLSPKKAEDALAPVVAKAGIGELLGLLIESMLVESIDYPSANDLKNIDALCKTLGLDRKKISADTIAELKREREAEKAPAATTKPPKPKAKARGKRGSK